MVVRNITIIISIANSTIDGITSCIVPVIGVGGGVLLLIKNKTGLFLIHPPHYVLYIRCSLCCAK